MKKLTFEFWAELYLDYFNDFLTVERFAEHHEMSEDLARAVIEHGRKCHNLLVDIWKVRQAREGG